MDRFAVRHRGDYRRHLEDDSDDREGLIQFEQLTRESEWRTQSKAKHRRVISQPEKNQALQTHGSRTPIHWTQLQLLKRGDHIGWHRPYMIWHHAIVVDIDVRNRELHVIHFTKVNGKAEIAKQWISVDEQLGDLFRFDYSRDITDVNPPDLVVERAERRIGERNYKLLSKNCEHFATFCKTGSGQSCQVHWAWGKVKETIHTTVVNGTKAVVKEVGKQTYRSMAESAGKVAAAETVERIGRASNWVGAGSVVVLETIHCAYDVYHIYQNRKARKISDRDFIATTTQRISEGVLGAGLAIGGGLLGEWVGGIIGGAIGSSVPVFGTAIGATIGSVIGGAIGSIVGKAIGSILGRWFGNFLWN